MFWGPVIWIYVGSKYRTRRGAEFSRFLPLVTAEGESQPVGEPGASFVRGPMRRELLVQIGIAMEWSGPRREEKGESLMAARCKHQSLSVVTT